MTLNELYIDCECKGIDIDYFPMREAKALSFPEGWIAIDVDKIENSVEEKEIIAQEEAHIETGSFYNIYSPFDISPSLNPALNAFSTSSWYCVSAIRSA